MSTPLTVTTYLHRKTTFLTFIVGGHLLSFYPFWMFDLVRYKRFQFVRHEGFAIHAGLFGFIYLPYSK